MDSDGSPFIDSDLGHVFYQDDLVIGLWDQSPVSPGHALVATRRVVPDWFAATEAEQAALLRAITHARDEILQHHQPDGFNIGINNGAAAGQTVFHLHVHVIPRYRDDVDDPRGGVRHVLSAKASCLDADSIEPIPVEDIDLGSTDSPLVTGGQHPLLSRLKADLATATHVDLAVAFIMVGGVDKIEESLRDILKRGGRVRIVTGDYLGSTDPDALLRLLDLKDASETGEFELHAFETSGGLSYHPKAYIIKGDEGEKAYIGSSNLSRTALEGGGVEWNYRVTSPSGFRAASEAYEKLLANPNVQVVDEDWIGTYRSKRDTADSRHEIVEIPVEVDEEIEPIPDPWPVQQRALDALTKTREEGQKAGLVVLATGLGKTWLSAFDFAFNKERFKRVLFVAHREEILEQARKTYRRILPSVSQGLFTGKEKTPDADMVFASVQTLSRKGHRSRFDPQHFDYIVIDEFHHASAATYRRLIDHFEPKFLLGLTATPERTDGGDILALCDHNLVFRCDLGDGIEKEKKLCPFKYFGVPDEVDYSNIPWRSTRFDEEELTKAVSTQKRAENAFEQFQELAGERVLAFCCSKRHADFMRDFFREKGIRAFSVHSGARSDPRTQSLERLVNGEAQIVFAVDMFNEGVDLPNVDTVMMLRPTESRILFLQQLGRGLRTAEGKDHLTVIDYIGNHRSFLLKVQALFNLGSGHHEVRGVLEAVDQGTAEFPEGCEVTYELEVINMLKELLQDPTKSEALQTYYEDFQDREGCRPSASNAQNDGFNPKGQAIKKAYGSWFGFVDSMGGLSEEQSSVWMSNKAFFEELETTKMVKSYKMLVLLSMLNQDKMPGTISLDDLAEGFEMLSDRSTLLRSDVGPQVNSRPELERLLIDQPIEALCGMKGEYFQFKDNEFRTTFDIPEDDRPAFQELVRELAEWRKDKYLASQVVRGAGDFVCKVSRHGSGGRPMLFLPGRESSSAIPRGWKAVWVAGKNYEANFVKIALNVVRLPDSEQNMLPGILEGWFGPDAGLPGTDHKVAVRLTPGNQEVYSIEPLKAKVEGGSVILWQSYTRKEVPELFGLEFKGGQWAQSGFIMEYDSNQGFLFVTLDKAGGEGKYAYKDGFRDRGHLQWESQNRTKKSGKHGGYIQSHVEKAFTFHLFVRSHRKESGTGKTMKSTYCGPVKFLSWGEAEQPITVQWELEHPVPDKWWKRWERFRPTVEDE